METHKGQCHCGAVAFTFTAPPDVGMTECDCSICGMTGYQHIFIPQDEVGFISGEDHLEVYTFGTQTAQHMFCRTCGIKPLYIPRSHPECYSVNLRCVVSGTLTVGETVVFNGQNWEENIDGLRNETAPG